MPRLTVSARFRLSHVGSSSSLLLRPVRAVSFSLSPRLCWRAVAARPEIFGMPVSPFPAPGRGAPRAGTGLAALSWTAASPDASSVRRCLRAAAAASASARCRILRRVGRLMLAHVAPRSSCLRSRAGQLYRRAPGRGPSGCNTGRGDLDVTGEGALQQAGDGQHALSGFIRSGGLRWGTCGRRAGRAAGRRPRRWPGRRRCRRPRRRWG